MARGRQTRKLTPDRIERLTRFRMARGYGFPVLRKAMAAPCGWKTLQKALLGLPVWDLHQAYITQWIDRYLPAPKTPDGKAAAAGEEAEPREPDESDEEEARAARTLRGSR